jgi:hypothetical protein
MGKMGRSEMDADLKRQRLIAEIANYLIRERALDRHGDHMVDVAFKHFKDRLEGNEFTLAVIKLIRTLREMVALDQIEGQFNYLPPPKPEPLPARKRSRKAPSGQLELFGGPTVKVEQVKRGPGVSLCRHKTKQH